MAPPRDRALAAFARNVLRARETKGFSQDTLAERADLDPTYISGIERGIRNPSLLSICAAREGPCPSVFPQLVEGVRE